MARKQVRRVRLELEALEDRNLMSGGLTAMSPASFMAGSLHQASQVGTGIPNAGILVLGLAGNDMTTSMFHSGPVGGVRGNHNETLVRDKSRRGRSRRKRA